MEPTAYLPVLHVHAEAEHGLGTVEGGLRQRQSG